MPIKIYLSGPISGHDKRLTEIRFNKAKEHFADTRFEPVSPLENGLPTSATYEEHMLRDIELLDGCQAIYMMNGWKKSNGCQIEFQHAIIHKKTIMFEQ